MQYKANHKYNFNKLNQNFANINKDLLALADGCCICLLFKQKTIPLH